MKRLYPLVLLSLSCLPTLAGCGSDAEPESPTGDELSQFLEENPEIAAEDDFMGELEGE